MYRSWIELFGTYLALIGVAGTGLGLATFRVQES